MGYLDYAGLQYLWSKLKEKFAPKSHSHDDRYYTESEMDGKLNSKVNNNEDGANGLLSKLTTSWTATPTDNTYFIRQDTGGGNSFGRVKFSTLWTYIKSKADGTYQPKGSYAASSHTHDDRYYTESEMNTKLSAKSENIVLASDTNLNNITTPGFYSCGGGNKITNKPNNTDAIGLIVTHNASGGYYTQILTTSSNANTYRRTCLNGTWSGWTQDKYTDTNTWRGIQNNLTSDSTSDSLSAAQGKALKTLVDGKAAVGHTHNSVKDAGDNSSNTTFAYSKSGMNYGDYSWLAGWNGYELRAINKNQFATAGHNHDSRYYTESEIDSKLDDKSNVGHTHDYLPTAGGTMNGTITFSDSSHGKIYSGPTDNVNGPGGDLNNIVIESWNGLSFTTGCPNQTYTGKTAVGIDCREGVVKAARFDGTLTGTAATLGGGGNPYAPMTFNWSGKDGQPTWLWGGEDGTNMYVYNPGNFSVNWAQGAANGVYANGFKSSRGGYIRFCNGLQICWGENNKNTTAAVFDVPFKTVDYTLVLGGTDDLNNAWYIASRTTTGFTPKQNGFAVVTNWIAIGRWN